LSRPNLILELVPVFCTALGYVEERIIRKTTHLQNNLKPNLGRDKTLNDLMEVEVLQDIF
jgi:hypothetical protein